MLEQVCRQNDARCFKLFREFWADARGNKLAEHASIGPYSLFFKQENVLHAKDIFIHPGDFRQMRYPSCSVAHSGQLDYDSDGRSHLLANSLFRKIKVCHQRHGFHTGNGITRTVRVNRGERAVMPRVHSLEHVQRLLATDLTYDDPVGSHTQTIDQQLPLFHSTLPFHVRRAALQADDVTLLQLQFCGVFYGYDSFLIGYESGKDIEESCFAGACSTGDNHAEPRFYGTLEKLQHRCRQSSVENQIVYG